MASINQAIRAAVAAGFVQTECAHRGLTHTHLTFDYPKPLTVPGPIGQKVWRLHIDSGKIPHVTHIAGPDTPEQRVSLKNAIDWVRRTAASHPKEK